MIRPYENPLVSRVKEVLGQLGVRRGDHLVITCDALDPEHVKDGDLQASHAKTVAPAWRIFRHCAKGRGGKISVLVKSFGVADTTDEWDAVQCGQASACKGPCTLLTTLEHFRFITTVGGPPRGLRRKSFFAGLRAWLSGDQGCLSRLRFDLNVLYNQAMQADGVFCNPLQGDERFQLKLQQRFPWNFGEVLLRVHPIDPNFQRDIQVGNPSSYICLQ